MQPGCIVRLDNEPSTRMADGPDRVDPPEPDNIAVIVLFKLVSKAIPLFGSNSGTINQIFHSLKIGSH